MQSIKHSNWILGFGILVAIVLIVTSLWFRYTPEQGSSEVINKSIPELSQSINQVIVKPIGWVASVIKTLI